ncbi:MAG: YybH family protein [Gemmatimonadales bacterium]
MRRNVRGAARAAALMTTGLRWAAGAVAVAIGIGSATVVTAQAKPSWPLPTVELPAELSRVLRDYEAAWKAGDGTRLAEVFTEDGFIMSNGRLPERGTAAIRASHTRPGGDLQLVTFGYATADTVGYIVGGYRYPNTVGPGGKFVLALRRDAQRRWRIAADIENNSQ